MELQPLDEPAQLQVQSPSDVHNILISREPDEADVVFTRRVVSALSYLEGLARMSAGDILALF